MESNLTRIRGAVERINWARGYGDIRECRLYGDGRIEVTIRRLHMHDTIRRGHAEGGKVYFAGTRRKY